MAQDDEQEVPLPLPHDFSLFARNLLRSDSARSLEFDAAVLEDLAVGLWGEGKISQAALGLLRSTTSQK
jgi:hypothetical protein